MWASCMSCRGTGPAMDSRSQRYRVQQTKRNRAEAPKTTEISN